MTYHHVRGRLGILFVLLIGLSSCGSDPITPVPEPAPAPADEDLAILFVGNSLTYTNSIPELLEAMLEAVGVGPLLVGQATYPDFGLMDHWVLGDARTRIAQGGWDVVVLQQGPSATEGRPSLLEYTNLFATEIRAGGGVPALYMVWPSESRSFDFDGVADSYTTAAEQVGGMLFPVGEAWRAAWRIDPAIELYGNDGFHPSVAGSYVAALVMLQQLSGQDPRALSTDFFSLGLPADVIETLQAAAAEANDLYALTPVG
jgi:hypothetical protein